MNTVYHWALAYMLLGIVSAVVAGNSHIQLLQAAATVLSCASLPLAGAYTAAACRSAVDGRR